MSESFPNWFCTNVGCLICPHRRDFQCLREEVINGNKEYFKNPLELYLKV